MKKEKRQELAAERKEHRKEIGTPTQKRPKQKRLTEEEQEALQELRDVRDGASESYGALVDLLLENGLMERDENYDTKLTIGLAEEDWGSDVPAPYMQEIVVEQFFEQVSLLDTVDAFQVLTAYLKNAENQRYVNSLEEEMQEVKAARTGA